MFELGTPMAPTEGISGNDGDRWKLGRSLGPEEMSFVPGGV